MKTLCCLNQDNTVDILAEIPETIRGISSSGKDVYLTDADQGAIFQWKDQSFSVFANGLPGVHGIQAQNQLLYCESPEHHFFHIRLFDRMITHLVGRRGIDSIGQIKSDRSIPHPRINGLQLRHHDQAIFLVLTERHSIYCLTNDSMVSQVAGSGKQGFSIGMNGAGSFSFPSDIAIAQDRIFVSDTGNHVIREFHMDKMRTSRLIGSPLTAGQTDGDISTTLLSNPTDMDYSHGVLYFVDDHNSIRCVIDKSLIVGTLYRCKNKIEAIASGPDNSVFFTAIS